VNSRITWTLFFLAAILLAVILLVERPLRQAAEMAGSTVVLPGLKPAEVGRIRLRLRGQPEIQVARTNGDWAMSAPLTCAAEPAKIERFLAAFTAMQWQVRLGAEDLKGRTNVAEEFGFLSPQATLTLDQGGYEHHLLVGSRMALGDQVSVQVVGGDGYYLVDAGILDVLPAGRNDWRDRRLLRWPVKPGARVRVVAGARSFELESSASNHLWNLVAPLPARADTPKIDALLEQLNELRVEQFVSDDSAADFDSFGLQTPDLEILLGQGTNYPTGLMVGRSPTNAPSLAFARLMGSPSVALVARTNLEPWRASLDDFRDRRLVSGASNQVAMLEFSGLDTFRVARDKSGAWKFLPPVQLEIDTNLMDRVVDSLARLEVTFEKAVVTDFAAYGLAAPRLRTTLWRDISGSPESLFAQVDFGAPQDGKVFTRRAGESSVNSIRLEDFRLFPQISWQLRDRRFWSFSAADVASVTVLQNGQTLRIVHRATNEWEVAPGYQGVINPFSVEEAVTRLGALQADSWAARGEDPRDPFNLKTMDHTVTMQVREEVKGAAPSARSEIRLRDYALRFGKLDGSEIPYAAVELDGATWVFRFPAALYREFITTDLSVRTPPVRPVR